ncbi:MAG: KpsF/GutQ family sugar-phosphate isomerase [Chitinophagales bacterium]|nr:KpsF/GutQ family sugar-phosphate isomerase [Chitinophagales bacterium]MDW8393289.1 KpsF/GutQ family sugar-phosphate isomerase [Chitinophagales bacterium]
MAKPKANHRSEILRIARATLEAEASAVAGLAHRLNATFVTVVRLVYQCRGRLIVTGIGKSALIAQKIVATLNSTGTPSSFLHAADAIHGDLGMIQPEDLLLCISNSGESPEIRVLVPLVRHNGNPIIAMVGNLESFLARNADYVLNASVRREACPNNLAPTASTAAQMALGDALAMCLLTLRGFSPADFAKLHPGGALGKRMYLRVRDLYVRHEPPKVLPSDNMQTVILEITTKRLGATAVLTPKGKLAGIITDGDLRRLMESRSQWNGLQARHVMTRNPKTIDENELAVNALELMRRHKITQLVVTSAGRYAGMVHVHDLLQEGLI